MRCFLPLLWPVELNASIPVQLSPSLPFSLSVCACEGLCVLAIFTSWCVCVVWGKLHPGISHTFLQFGPSQLPFSGLFRVLHFIVPNWWRLYYPTGFWHKHNFMHTQIQIQIHVYAYVYTTYTHTHTAGQRKAHWEEARKVFHFSFGKVDAMRARKECQLLRRSTASAIYSIYIIYVVYIYMYNSLCPVPYSRIYCVSVTIYA